MERSELIEKLSNIFRSTFSDDELIISDELNADDVDNWNSLTHMILISDVEKEFNVKFKLKELNKMKNVGALIELIQSKL